MAQEIGFHLVSVCRSLLYNFLCIKSKSWNDLIMKWMSHRVVRIYLYKIGQFCGNFGQVIGRPTAILSVIRFWIWDIFVSKCIAIWRIVQLPFAWNIAIAPSHRRRIARTHRWSFGKIIMALLQFMSPRVSGFFYESHHFLCVPSFFSHINQFFFHFCRFSRIGNWKW